MAPILRWDIRGEPGGGTPAFLGGSRALGTDTKELKVPEQREEAGGGEWGERSGWEEGPERRPQG